MRQNLRFVFSVVLPSFQKLASCSIGPFTLKSPILSLLLLTSIFLSRFQNLSSWSLDFLQESECSETSSAWLLLFFHNLISFHHHFPPKNDSVLSLSLLWLCFILISISQFSQPQMNWNSLHFSSFLSIWSHEVRWAHMERKVSKRFLWSTSLIVSYPERPKVPRYEGHVKHFTWVWSTTDRHWSSEFSSPCILSLSFSFSFSFSTLDSALWILGDPSCSPTDDSYSPTKSNPNFFPSHMAQLFPKQVTMFKSIDWASFPPRWIWSKNGTWFEM